MFDLNQYILFDYKTINKNNIINFNINNINNNNFCKIIYQNYKFQLLEKSKLIDSCREGRVIRLINYFNSLNIKISKNAILIINVEDKNITNLNIPIFAYNKEINNKALLLYNDYFLLYNKIFKLFNHDIKEFDTEFNNKKNKIIFIGDNNSKIRFNICNKYKDNINTLFKLLNKDQIEYNNSNDIFSNRLSLKEQLIYKYQLCIDGHGTSFNRFPWQLKSNSLVFKIDSNLIEWYYPFIESCYIKCNIDNIIEKKKYYDNHINEALKIINNANVFADKFFNENMIKKYTTLLLEKYINMYE